MIASALVTGASGFIGGALVQRLADRGVRTVALLREGGRGLRGDAPAEIEPLRVRSLARADLEPALASRRFDAIFHLASYGVDPSQRDPRAMIDGNVGLVVDVLQATRPCAPAVFVHAGTWSEYGPLEEPSLLTESSPIAPRSQYAAAKAASSMVGGALAADLGIRFVTLRLFHVYGPGEAEHRLVPYLCERLHRGELPELTGGEQVRDLVHVDDVADAFVAAAAAQVAPAAYNVCSGTPVRVRDVAETVASVLGVSRQLVGLGRVPYRAHEPMWAVGDPSRFRAATGWAPKVAVREGVDAAVRYEQARRR